jgi:hypothetical protein
MEAAFGSEKISEAKKQIRAETGTIQNGENQSF